MNGRFDARVLISIGRIVKSEDIDIIHTHGYKSDVIGLLVAKYCKIKSITTPHGFENSNDKKLQYYIKLGNYFLRYFDFVVPLSKELVADMIKLNVPVSKIKLIRNGVDLTELPVKLNEPNMSKLDCSRCKKIGYVGQLESRKNVIDIIKAFDLMYFTNQNIKLYIIGDGNLRESLQDFAASLRSGSAIEFLGFRADCLDIVRELDLFTMTSTLEGIPRSMMEAMGIGVPVVAYDIPGVDELIINDQTGLLSPFGDIAKLKECWDKVLFNRTISNRVGSNGHRRIYNMFSASRMAQEYIVLYRELFYAGIVK
jgi:glycosyltransferase involved in cell wall biosynthesis